MDAPPECAPSAARCYDASGILKAMKTASRCIEKAPRRVAFGSRNAQPARHAWESCVTKVNLQNERTAGGTWSLENEPGLMNLLRLSISPLPAPAGWYALPLRLIIGFGFMQHGYAKLKQPCQLADAQESLTRARAGSISRNMQSGGSEKRFRRVRYLAPSGHARRSGAAPQARARSGR